jgi:hypothetical protein
MARRGRPGHRAIGRNDQILQVLADRLLISEIV